MALADFISGNMEAILQDWETFAATLVPAAKGLDPETLRDFAEGMLAAVAEQVSNGEPPSQQAPGGGSRVTAAARRHAAERLSESFTQEQLVAEFRALRASVVRRWKEQLATVGPAELEELTRFDEAVDQLLTESIAYYDRKIQAVRDQLNESRAHELRLRDLARDREQLLSMLAHELRNPLAPILNASQVLLVEAQDQSARIQGAAAMIERQAQHLAYLVNDLFDMERVRSKRLQLRRQVVDLAAVTHEAVENARPGAQASRLGLSVYLPDEPLTADADPDRLAQVIANLLDNAVKFTPAGGRIEVALQKDGAEALLSVRDSGAGIPEDLLPRVFELFAQGDETLDRSASGLGLGLHLVKLLVEMHGGSVDARSDGRGRGSEFVVRLPLSTRPRQPATRQNDAPPTDAKRVLVVEDNVDAAESLAMLLQTLGHEVRVANSGSQGIALVRVFEPEICLLDLGLPGMDGAELARRLRAEFGKSIRLVAVTGYDQEIHRRATMEAGFDLHLVKPVSIVTLTQALSDDSASPASCP